MTITTDAGAGTEWDGEPESLSRDELIRLYRSLYRDRNLWVKTAQEWDRLRMECEKEYRYMADLADRRTTEYNEMYLKHEVLQKLFLRVQKVLEGQGDTHAEVHIRNLDSDGPKG